MVLVTAGMDNILLLRVRTFPVSGIDALPHTNTNKIYRYVYIFFIGKARSSSTQRKSTSTVQLGQLYTGHYAV